MQNQQVYSYHNPSCMAGHGGEECSRIPPYVYKPKPYQPTNWLHNNPSYKAGPGGGGGPQVPANNHQPKQNQQGPWQQNKHEHKAGPGGEARSMAADNKSGPYKNYQQGQAQKTFHQQRLRGDGNQVLPLGPRLRVLMEINGMVMYICQHMKMLFTMK